VNYYNEIDPAAAQWLRNLIAKGLIPPGVVDERSIEDITPNELREYTQCHFFAGIGGWPLALALAGWPVDRPVWTGSCPCQPFSTAGRGDGFADQRHLWPAWFHLIRECKPGAIFGEQVAGAVGHGWLDLVSSDLESQGYAVGSAVLGAHSVGAPHIRQRLYFVADPGRERHNGQWLLLQRDESGRLEADFAKASGGGARVVGDAINAGSQGHGRLVQLHDSEGWEGARRHGAAPGLWAGEWRVGADGKARLIEPSIEPMAHGIPARVVRLRAYGNAIVPQVAAAFIRAYAEREAVCVAA
jgi:DNA (cytosine-5)-methyltransferase 1